MSSIIAKHYEKTDVAKNIKSTKQKFLWIIHIDGKDYTIVLFASWLSHKRRITVNGVTITEKTVPEGQKTFEWDYVIRHFDFKIKQKEKNFDLYIDGLIFEYVQRHPQELLRKGNKLDSYNMPVKSSLKMGATGKRVSFIGEKSETVVGPTRKTGPSQKADKARVDRVMAEEIDKEQLRELERQKAAFKEFEIQKQLQGQTEHAKRKDREQKERERKEQRNEELKATERSTRRGQEKKNFSGQGELKVGQAFDFDDGDLPSMDRNGLAPNKETREISGKNDFSKGGFGDFGQQKPSQKSGPQDHFDAWNFKDEKKVIGAGQGFGNFGDFNEASFQKKTGNANNNKPPGDFWGSNGDQGGGSQGKSGFGDFGMFDSKEMGVSTGPPQTFGGFDAFQGQSSTNFNNVAPQKPMEHPKQSANNQFGTFEAFNTSNSQTAFLQSSNFNVNTAPKQASARNEFDAFASMGPSPPKPPANANVTNNSFDAFASMGPSPPKPANNSSQFSGFDDFSKPQSFSKKPDAGFGNFTQNTPPKSFDQPKRPAQQQPPMDFDFFASPPKPQNPNTFSQTPKPPTIPSNDFFASNVSTIITQEFTPTNDFNLTGSNFGEFQPKSIEKIRNDCVFIEKKTVKNIESDFFEGFGDGQQKKDFGFNMKISGGVPDPFFDSMKPIGGGGKGFGGGNGMFDGNDLF
jgi:hypothetical protein